MKRCSHEGCNETHSAKGFCRRHYYQHKNGWKPLATLGMDLPTRIAHYAKPDGKCLVWTGAKNKQGYGLISVANVRKLVTRVVWDSAHGPIPDGLHVLHRCDNPACILLAHLFVGTHKDNMNDRDAKGRCMQGRGHHFAKLTAEQFQAVKDAEGPQREIARMFGITQATVSNIKKGVTKS